MDSELIEKLLQTTGLSCDDLLTKLQQYRSGRDKTEHESSSSDSYLDKETDLREKCPTPENNSVILETENSSVADNKINKIQTHIEIQTNDDGHSDQISQKLINKDDNIENEAKLSQSEEIEETSTAPKRLESATRISCETVEDTTCERKDQECTLHIDSISEQFEANCENLKNLGNVADLHQSHKSDVENRDSFNFLKKNRSNKMKISDYLESILNCRKSERKSQEDVDRNETAVIEDFEHYKQNETRNKSLQLDSIVEKVTESISDKPCSQAEECIAEPRVKVTEPISTVGPKFSAEAQQGNSNTGDEKLSVEKIPSVNDHNYSSFGLGTNLQQETSVSNEITELDVRKEALASTSDVLPESEDNLRNILKMQLSSLRNMKKSSGYLPDLKKPTMFFHNLKKKRKSCDLNSGILSATDDDKDESNEDTIEKKIYQKESSSNENSLVSLAEETDFVILNVTGGVDRMTPIFSEADKEERMFAVISDAKNKEVEHSDSLKNEKGSNSSSAVASDNLPGEGGGIVLKTYKKRMNNSLEKSPTINKERLPNVSVKKNISENFNQDPGVNKSVKNSEKSPFVSDSLEDFLSESAQLKISYPIPKLGAEEGISESTKASPFDSIVNKIEPPKVEQDVAQKEPKLVKAKTLAEMRRHFEKLKAMEKGESDSFDIATPLSRYKKNKLFKKHGLKIKQDEKNEDENKDASCDTLSNTYNVPSHRNSVIMYDNKKLWVSSKVANKCFGFFHSKIGKDGSPEKIDKASSLTMGPSPVRKPSLLSSLSQNKSKKVTYKPGPLCKKANLQNVESRDEWVTEVKTLPKIYLEVVPEVHKPIDPAVVHLLPIFDEVVVTEDRVNFALSVLQQKNQIGSKSESQAFNFHIPYSNGQEQIVVRKPGSSIVYRGDKENKETDPMKDIAGVLSDIITYVETKEIEDTIIKEDDFVAEPDTKAIESPTKTRKHKIKRKKLELELLRLNCKVIDVATSETQDKDCSKPFCKLGCVCKSLQCDSVFSNHCQLVECMFGCTCSSETFREAAASNNSLSAHTVNHLEDKAKKNLAKVEREFTQTFIHTDNDAILVGTAKMRRSSKPPKKYTDYVAEDVLFENSRPVTPRKTSKSKTCSVVLQKLDMNDIIPLCLVHNLYNCHCKGETVLAPEKTNEIEQIPKIRIVKTKEDQHKAWFESCARIRKVFPEYKERNKNPIYNEKLLMKNLGTIIPNFAKQKKQALGNDKSNSVSPVSKLDSDAVKKPNKRKQSFTIREDVALKCSPKKKQKEFALQRRKKKPKLNIVPKDVSLYNPVFDGEIKVSLKDNKDMLKIIGSQHQSLEYLRILPWSKLIDLFRSKRINIWTKENRSAVLLCNTAGHFPPKNFVDIRKVSYKSEIIDWILTDSLPPDRPRDLMHLILTPKKFNFLIAGYCLKKPSEKDQAVNSQIIPEDLNKTLATDPLQISPDAKSAKSSGLFEEIRVDEDMNLNENYDGNSGISMQETNKEKLADFVFGKNDEAVSVFVSKMLETAPSDPLATSSSSNKKPVNSRVKLPMERRIKIVRPEMWVCRDIVTEKDSQSMASKNLGPAVKKNLCGLKTKRHYVKLKSILNTVPLVSDINTTTIESSLNLQSPTDADKLKAFFNKKKQNSAVNPRKRKQESRFSSISLEDPLEGDSAQLDNEIDTSLTTEKEQRDPLEITGDESTSAILQSLETFLPNTTVSESVISKNYSNEKSTKLREENNKKRRRYPFEIKDKLTLSQQLSKSLQIVPKEKPMVKRCKQNLPVTNYDKTPMTFQQCFIPSRSLKCTHKDINNRSKTLVLTNKVFYKRKIYCNKDGQGFDILAPLPPVQKNLRWRMIYLNSDFTFLTFTRADYSIKYTDLMDVVKMSNNIRSTITLRNKEFSDHYKHPQFGIFCVPEFQDRLFVGPFLAAENHNIETVRYLQRRLIDTQIFNKMVGKKGNEKEPLWVYESSSQAKNIPKDVVIDITEDDEVPEIAVVELDSDSSEESQQLQEKLTNSLLCPPFVEELTPDELKSRHINRYIITNVPHLGYFGACQRDTKAIEVFWAGGTKGYRFPNVTFTKNVLTQYLSQIFCPIPQDFKINVIIMTNIDTESNKPIDTKYFSQAGPYFCGEFGIFEKHNVPEDLLEQYKISSLDSLTKWHQETQEDEAVMIKIFGLFLMNNEELRKYSDPQSILQWAISEIYILKKLSLNYESEKADLENIIRINSQKMKEKRKEQRDEDTTNKDLGNVSETIEIEDSDEDNQGSNKEKTNIFRKISTSGKIKPSAVYSRDKDRSLLKPNWRPFLKHNEKEDQNRIEKARPVAPVTISLNHSNIILNKSKLLVTKLK